MAKSVEISVNIARDAREVFDYVSNLHNLRHWASAITPGTAARTADSRTYGVIDQWVTVGTKTYFKAIRVVDYYEASTVIFTLRGTPDIDEADAAAIAADLQRLKRVLEER